MSSDQSCHFLKLAGDVIARSRAPLPTTLIAVPAQNVIQRMRALKDTVV